MELENGWKSKIDQLGILWLKSHQKLVIHHLLCGHHVIGVFPTGYGKSLIYQLLAMASPPVLVISPLISLIADQKDRARDLGLFTLCSGELRRTPKAPRFLHRSDIVFCSPEYLEKATKKDEVFSFAKFIIFDECHCLIQWGNTFRPSYISAYRKILMHCSQKQKTLYLSATLTNSEANWIAHHHAAAIQVIRPPIDESRNLTESPHVQKFDSANKRLDYLRKLLGKESKPTVIFCTTQSECERLAREFAPLSAYYHGGLTHIQRERSWSSFLKNERIYMFATTAFGLGVHKPDIRGIIFYGLPLTNHDFIQGMGRGGRDGLGLRVEVLWCEKDLEFNQQLMLDGATSSRSKYQQVLKLIECQKQILKM